MNSFFLKSIVNQPDLPDELQIGKSYSLPYALSKQLLTTTQKNPESKYFGIMASFREYVFNYVFTSMLKWKCSCGLLFKILQTSQKNIYG